MNVWYFYYFLPLLPHLFSPIPLTGKDDKNPSTLCFLLTQQSWYWKAGVIKWCCLS